MPVFHLECPSCAYSGLDSIEWTTCPECGSTLEVIMKYHSSNYTGD